MNSNLSTALLRAGWLALFAVAALLPIIIGQAYLIHILALVLIMTIAVMAMQLLLGFTGLLSIGQAAFLGIGAYSSALLTMTPQWPFPLAFLAAGALSGLASLCLVPITRLRGTYLGVATLGFSIIVHLVILNEEWLTGGSFGLLGIPAPSLGPWRLTGEMPMYYLSLVVLVLVAFCLKRLTSGRFGRALRAIMQDEDAARASGIDVTVCKSKAFVIASVLTGFAGALFAHHSQYLSPNDFTFWKSVDILIMAAIGGIGSFSGALLGAAIVVLLPEALQALDEGRQLIFGVLLIVIMSFGQRGLAGALAPGLALLTKRNALAR